MQSYPEKEDAVNLISSVPGKEETSKEATVMNALDKNEIQYTTHEAIELSD